MGGWVVSRRVDESYYVRSLLEGWPWLWGALLACPTGMRIQMALPYSSTII